MLYPDPRTLQQLIDHHDAPLLAEAEARHLTSDPNPGYAGGGRGDTPHHSSGSALRHLFAVMHHSGPHLHRAHP